MKRSGWLWMSAISCLAAVAAMQAATDNPYQKIIERNVFGLNPPPPPPAPPEPPAPPIPKITLQGVTTILGNRQVLFKALTLPAPGKPINEQSYILSEGEREDDIEAVAINEVEGTVKFNNHGTIQELNLKTDSAKASVGGVVPAPKPPIPVPVFTQNTPDGSPEGDAGLRRIPQRSVRTTPEEDAADAGQAQPAEPAQPAQVASGPSKEEPMPTLEEQTILIELNRERSKNDPDAPPFPPTELTPPGSPYAPDPDNPADNPPTMK